MWKLQNNYQIEANPADVTVSVSWLCVCVTCSSGVSVTKWQCLGSTTWQVTDWKENVKEMS